MKKIIFLFIAFLISNFKISCSENDPRLVLFNKELEKKIQEVCKKNDMELLSEAQLILLSAGLPVGIKHKSGEYFTVLIKNFE